MTTATTFPPNQVIDAAEAIRNVTNPLFKGPISGRDRKALARLAAWPGLSKGTASLVGLVLDGTILLPMEDACGVPLFQAMNELPMVSDAELEAWTPDWEAAVDAPTYHRCRDNGQHEIVVRARGGLWAFTATESDLPFDQYVSVHVHTGQFAVYAALPEFFQALADRQPATLTDLALLLDELGVADDTAGYERRRQQAAGWPQDDSWPYL